MRLTIIITLLILAGSVSVHAADRRVYHDYVTAVNDTTLPISVDISPLTTSVSIEVRASIDRMREKQGAGNQSWGIIFATDRNGIPYSVNLTPANSDFGSPFDVRYMEVTIAHGDSVIISRRIDSGFSLTRGAPNTLVAEIDISKSKATFFGGSRKLLYLDEIQWEGILYTAITSNTSVTVSTLMTETATDPIVISITGRSEDEIAEYLTGSSDPIEGYWSYLDRDNDPVYAIPGGSYKLALITSHEPEGGYDIIYMGGATTRSSLWKPGMLKGRLIPTQFIDHYDLLWIDATFSPITRDIHASVSQGTILTLSFPLYHTTLRFSRDNH